MKRYLFILICGIWILVSGFSFAILDTNSNTLSDLWEEEFNDNQLFPSTFAPQADSDGDGWTNEQEAAAGTNPSHGNPPDGIICSEILHIPATYFTSPEGTELLTPEAFKITWPTLTGKQYTLYGSPDLTPGSWIPIGTPLIAAGGTTSTTIPVTQPDGTAPEKLFWRVAVSDVDTDEDNLTNSEEDLLGTNPAASDSDYDGLSDHTEMLAGLNPNHPDYDLDGILDGSDPTPFANNAIANPDGENLPAMLTTKITGRWDLEAINIANGVQTTPNASNSSMAATLGGGVVADPSGMVSKAIHMSGMNQYIKTNPSTITGKASFSISLWFRFEKNYLQNKPGNLNTVLFAYNDVLDTTPLFQLHAYKAITAQATQKLVFSHYSNSLIQPDIVGEITLSAALDDGQWQHITFTKSAGTIRIYRNSQLVISGGAHSGTWATGVNAYLCFGALAPATLETDTNFRGSMDRIRTWSEEIGLDEVRALYRQDIDRDGLWDITEGATRYSDYQNTVIYHPDPADPTAPLPTQTGYARSPFLYSSGTLDFDQDELNDLAEQAAGTRLTKPDTDDDNLTDGFEVFNNFNPLNAYSQGATGPRDDLGDPDSDTLTTLTEYFSGSNPRNANSDGDATNDATEVAQGSDPANAADSGAPPTDSPEPVPFHIFGDYTAWEATIKGKGPNDTRTRRFRMSAHNVAADQTLNLLRGNAYELSLRYIRTKPGESVPWYCWEATIDGKTAPTYTVADHWLVDNSSALLAEHTHSHGTNLVAEKKVNLLPVEVKAYRPEMVQQSVDLRPADQSKLVIPYAETVNPGVRIRVNHDDDDDEPNGRPYDPDGSEDSVTGENDLIKVEFACPIPAGSGIKVFLKRSSANLRVWESKEKGGSILRDEDEKELTLDAQQKKILWVEASEEGGGELEWELRSDSGVIGTGCKLKFITYISLLVGVSGETFGAAGAAAGNGIFNVCQKLYLEGYNVAYYDVNGIDPVTDNPAKREARLQITSCNVVDLGIYGHSHGGGATYGISKGLNDIRNIIGNFNLKFTGYIDAIEHDGGTSDPFAETRLPPSTAYHWNYYQRKLITVLRGNAVSGAALNLNVNDTAWGAALDHVTIDNDQTVRDHLYSAIKAHVTP